MDFNKVFRDGTYFVLHNAVCSRTQMLGYSTKNNYNLQSPLRTVHIYTVNDIYIYIYVYHLPVALARCNLLPMHYPVHCPDPPRYPVPGSIPGEGPCRCTDQERRGAALVPSPGRHSHCRQRGVCRCCHVRKALHMQTFIFMYSPAHVVISYPVIIRHHFLCAWGVGGGGARGRTYVPLSNTINGRSKQVSEWLESDSTELDVGPHNSFLRRLVYQEIPSRCVLSLLCACVCVCVGRAGMIYILNRLYIYIYILTSLPS
jgi:hypothetical protein